MPRVHRPKIKNKKHHRMMLIASIVIIVIVWLLVFKHQDTPKDAGYCAYHEVMGKETLVCP
jgi:sugar phosphate permease